jgi:cullin 1
MPAVEDKKKVIENVTKDRKYLLEAAIVRTMKSRKSLEHNQLMFEVMQQVRRMFTADAKMIKKCIEDLIEREFIERDSSNARRYNYLA